MELKKLIEHSLDREVDAIYIHPPYRKYFFRLLGEDENSYIYHKKGRKNHQITEIRLEQYMKLKGEIDKAGKLKNESKEPQVGEFKYEYKGIRHLLKVTAKPENNIGPMICFIVIKNKAEKIKKENK